MAKSASYFFIILMTAFKLALHAKDYKSPLYTQYAMEIIHSFSKQVKQEFGFDCIGSGGSMPHDVEEISVDFNIYKNATVPQARELEIKLTEKLLQILNGHEKIKPFLREYPFTASRTCVSLSFEKPKTGTPFSIKDQLITYVFHVRDRIFYQIENPSNPYLYKTIKEEPYEEALKIVQVSKQK